MDEAIAPAQLRGGRLVYLGGYVDERVVRERALRSPNTAGSNRMVRIARALVAAGFRPILLSPATSLRAGCRGKCVYPSRIHRAGRAPVVFAAMVNIPGLNVLVSPVMQFLALRRILLKGDTVAAVIYNFNPSLVLLAAYLKYVWRLPLVQNVEDVSEPRLSDWLPGAHARPVQQLIFWISQHIIARMVEGYIVPSRRFLNHLPAKTRVAVVSGCIAIEGDAPRTAPPPLRVFFAGKIEREHGVHKLVEALKLLDKYLPVPAIEVDVTGGGGMAEWVRREFAGLTGIQARYHGYVSDEAYRELLTSAQVCVALQDPKGRYASFKTPSKVYEFLGYGKAVIATDVGDIAELDGEVLTVLPALDATALAAALDLLAGDPEATASLRRRAWAHARTHFSYMAVGAVLRGLMPTGSEHSGSC